MALQRYAYEGIKHPWRELIGTLAFVFIGLFVGQLLGYLLSELILGVSREAFAAAMQAPSRAMSPAIRQGLLLTQALSGLCAFVLGPWLCMRYVYKHRLRVYGRLPAHGLWTFGLATLVYISFMVFNAWVAAWNADMVLPSFMRDFEVWAQAQEAIREEMVGVLVHVDSFTGFLVILLVVALIPALGEEFVFRGLLQTQLTAAFRNAHVGICLSACLFGLLHVQLYGLFPRVLLGVLFGYLYYFSGSLSVSVWAHFFNNGITLLMIYLQDSGRMLYDVAEESALGSNVALVGLLVGMLLMYIFIRLHAYTGKRNSVDKGVYGP